MKKLPKPRNPIAANVRQLGKRIVKSKKGKGSYTRKSKFKTNY